MKKRCFALALLLLLSGCTSAAGPSSPPSAGTASPSPGTSASPSGSPIPITTPENTWWDGKTVEDLPTKVEPIGNISSMDGPVCLALLPDADIGLYGDGDPTLGVLLRKGDYLQFFPQTYSTARYTSPELRWADMDGDGEEELAVKYLVNDTAGNIVYELHIYEWDGRGWIDHAFDKSCFAPLLEGVITYQYRDGYVNLVAGGSSSSTWYSGEEEPNGLAPIGNLVFFRQESGGYLVIFGLRLALPDGKEADVATLTARLVYDGTGFSLKNYTLESIGGV